MSPSLAALPTNPEEITDERLKRFVDAHPRLFVLTGAGCSTDSGIPDYRDTEGAWKRSPPMTYQLFMGSEAARARYWARSMVGWRHFGHARPNATHHALAELGRRGRVEALMTQNVDGLHEAAGSTGVIDLHGRLDRVRCMDCGDIAPRAPFQRQLADGNPGWLDRQAAHAPDGDADLEADDFNDFVVPTCLHCGGVLKPDVVYFGENVPRERVERAMHHLHRADAMLVVGSSLMVYSGYRFVVEASRRGIPIAAVNLGVTRADALLTLKVQASCAEALAFVRP